jgi:hypothetical protein
MSIYCNFRPTGNGREHQCRLCGDKITPRGTGPINIRMGCRALLRGRTPEDKLR